MKKNIKKMNIVIIFILSVATIVSCSKIDELENYVANSIKSGKMKQLNLDQSEFPIEQSEEGDESGKIKQFNIEQSVKAGNEDYIIMQEITEEEKVEETSAEHPYQIYNFVYPKNINIGQDKFLTQINTIRKNIEKFTESVVTLEGMYGMYISHDNSMTHPIVYRNGPGCCGNDDYDGFLLINVENAYQGAEPLRLNDWIKVVGTPFMHEHTNNIGENEEYLFLITTSIEKLDLKSRGAEMVND